MKDIASLADSERAKLYRSYAEAMRKQAQTSGSGLRDYFLKMAQSWDQLAASIERVAPVATSGRETSSSPDRDPDKA